MSFFMSICAASSKSQSGEVISPTPGDSPFMFENTDYLHFITYGQSLSVGSETTPALSTENVLGNKMIGDAHWLKTATIFNQFNPATIAPDFIEGVAIPWANAFKTALARDLPSHPANNQTIVATTAGEGGRTIAQLSGGVDYQRFLDTLTYGKQIADAEGKTISCPALVWMQGESEPSTQTKEGYKTAMLNLFNQMRADVASVYGQTKLPPFILYQPKDFPASAELHMAYLEMNNEYDWMMIAASIDTVPYRGIHLDPNGSRMFAEMCAKVMIQSIASGTEFQPLRPIDISFLGNEVTLVYNRNVMFDPEALNHVYSQLYGFQISYNLQQSIRIEEGNKVIITASEDLASYPESLLVVYKEGCIRDADTYEATTIYTDYVDNSGGSPAINHYYDGDGNIIYGQKYPMYNWGVRFKHQLT